MPLPYFDVGHQLSMNAVAIAANESTFDKTAFKDVVVVGNGPSALSLSAFLSGYLPFYDSSKPHPNAQLREKLEPNAAESILFQDFEYLSSGLEGRSSRGVSLLYDTLSRPNADLGEQHCSSIKWIKDENSEKLVDHVCVGEGLPGGTWQGVAPDLLTLSFGSWLDLPAYSFRQWVNDGEMCEQLNFDPESRVPCWSIAKYYQDYTRVLGLEKNFMNHTKIISVTKIDDTLKQKIPLYNYQINYSVNHPNDTTVQNLILFAKKLVLACGSNKPKKLKVPNEHLPLVFHTNHILESLIDKLKSQCKLQCNEVWCKMDNLNVSSHCLQPKMDQAENSNKNGQDEHFEENCVQRSSYTCHKEWFKDFCRKMTKNGCGVNFDEICTDLNSFYQQWLMAKMLKNDVNSLQNETDQCKPHCQSIFERKIDEKMENNNKNLRKLLNFRSRCCDQKILAQLALHCDPVLVVGDGLSAADAISRLLVEGVPVVHSFRKILHDSRHNFAKLSRAVHPDYHSVYQLMTSKNSNNLYTVYAGTEILAFEHHFDKNNVLRNRTILVKLKNVHNFDEDEPEKNCQKFISCSAVIVDIGSEPDLNFLLEPKSDTLTRHKNTPGGNSRFNPVQVNPFTSQCFNCKDIYALGPLIGDNYVRFIVGGAMACASDLLKSFCATSQCQIVNELT